MKLGWTKTCLGDIADYINGRAFKPGEWQQTGKPIIRIQNLNNPDAKFNFSTQVHEQKYAVKKGDLLFAWSASLGAYIWNGGDAWLNQHIFKVQPKPFASKEFIYYLLEKITSELYAKAHGSGMVHVTKKKFDETEVYLPPLNEQRSIVAKIEELFSELDQGITNLKTAQAQLKVYRQALLKHAFEGKLTAEWRVQNADKLESASALQQRIQDAREQRDQQQLAEWHANGKQGSKPKVPKPITPCTAEKLAELPELPEGWGYFCAEELCDFITKGTTPSKEKLFKNAGDVPFIKVYNLTKTGKLDFTIEPTFVSHETHHGFLNRSKVYPGDVLMNIVGPPLGKVSIVPDTHPEWNINQAIAIFRSEHISPKLLSIYLSDERIVNSMMDKSKATAGQFNLTLEICRETIIPIFSKEEQTFLEYLLDERISEIDQLYQTITTSLQQAEALRQSILKKAFSGELVTQNIEDEPASALLERIKAEKAPQQTFTTEAKSQKAKPPKDNVVPFPTKVPAIDTTELHAGLMALAYRCHEQHKKAWYFGHVKAEKISHMIESLIGIDLERVPIQDAAGPNDFKRLLEVESLARQKQWFDVRKQPNGRYFLIKLSGFDALIQRTEKALGAQLESVNALIELFIPLNKTRSEIVATLYAAWNNLLLSGHKPSDDEIVLEARDRWHIDKLKIRKERFSRCLIWMRKHGLIPHGRGIYVIKKNLRNVPRGQHD